VGPVAELTRSANLAPTSAASSAFTRTDVIEALWITNGRSGPANLAGTASRGPKLTTSSAPGATLGDAACLPRSPAGTGGQDPAYARGELVAVRSTTPSIEPASISSSRARPPAPWVEHDGLEARGLQRACRPEARGVVTPTSDRDCARRPRPAASPGAALPSPCRPCVRCVRGTRATRVEALDVRDRVHEREVAGPDVPAAVPRGHRRHEQGFARRRQGPQLADRWWSPRPPRPLTPSQRPSPARATTRSAADHRVRASPRDRPPRRPARRASRWSRGPGTAVAGTSARRWGGQDADVHEDVLDPGSRRRSRTKIMLRALGSSG